MPVIRDGDPRGDREHVRNAPTHAKWRNDPALLPKYREAVRMSAEGMTGPEIAAALEIKGSRDVAARTALRWVAKGLELWKPAGVDEMREIENAKLNDSEARLLEVVRNPGLAYGSSGRPVIDPETGSPIINRHVIIAAERALKSLRDRRANLNGLDVAVPVHVRVTATPIVDAEIERLAAELAAHGPGPRLELERGRDWTVTPDAEEAAAED